MVRPKRHGKASCSERIRKRIHRFVSRSGYEKNGKLLAEKLKEIYDVFGRKLIVIGHSKGGVDTQSALVYHNAHPYVEKVITLGSLITGRRWQI